MHLWWEAEERSSLRPTSLRARSPFLTSSMCLTLCSRRNSTMTLSVRVRPSSFITAQRLHPSKEQDEPVVWLMDLSSECVLSLFMRTESLSIQSLRCRDAHLRNLFFRWSSGERLGLMKYWEEQSSLLNSEISAMQLKTCKQPEPWRW